MPVTETHRDKDPKAARNRDEDGKYSLKSDTGVKGRVTRGSGDDLNLDCGGLKDKGEGIDTDRATTETANDNDNETKGVDYFTSGLSDNGPNRVPRFSNLYLKPNATYLGQQESDKGKFHVKVELKTVDLINSLVTGFLQISGLIDTHPEITTFFKGEIINNPLNKYHWQTDEKKLARDMTVNKYSFATEKPQWGSCLKNDLEHWRRLTGSTHLSDGQLKAKLVRIQNDYDINDDCIYMRWKEEFLLPDSRVKQIKGASFEGFYYIVLNLTQHSNLPGTISGLYYHKESDKFQSLSLKFVEDNGVSNTFDFV